MIRPMNDFVFVRVRKETVSPGGILLVDIDKPWTADQENPQVEGEVVAVGPGLRHKKKPQRRQSMWDLAPGQRIAFSPNGNLKQVVNGEELTVIRRDSIYGEVC